MVRVKKSMDSVEKRTHHINNKRRNSALLQSTTRHDITSHHITSHNGTLFFGRANQNGIFFYLSTEMTFSGS